MGLKGDEIQTETLPGIVVREFVRHHARMRVMSTMNNTPAAMSTLVLPLSGWLRPVPYVRPSQKAPAIVIAIVAAITGALSG